MQMNNSNKLDNTQINAGVQDEKRNIGIDLLRILAMYMIVLFHIINHGGVRNAVTPGTGQFTAVWVMEAILCCSVNIYAIISGYVGYTLTEKKRKNHKFIVLWLQVFFYSLVFYLVVSCVTGSYSLKNLIKSCLPVTTSQYWYFTAYVGVYFIAPYINRMIRQMKEANVKKYFLGLILILLYLSVVGILYDPFIINGGYSFLWLFILYIVGAFIKKFNLGKNIDLRISVICFLVCWCIALCTKLLLPTFDIFTTYTSITTMAMSVTFILIFSKMKIEANHLPGKIIKKWH